MIPNFTAQFFPGAVIYTISQKINMRVRVHVCVAEERSVIE
jgi:hypothetical protein